MIINTNKTKELIICFNKKVNTNEIPQFCIHGSNFDRVTNFKLLGVFISSEFRSIMGLSCYTYATESCKTNVLYLVKTDIPVCDILRVYCTVIRSILEYVCRLASWFDEKIV